MHTVGAPRRTPAFLGDVPMAIVEAIERESSWKAWVAVWRALELQKVQQLLLQRSGLEDGLGLVDDQRSDTVEMRTLAGQMVTVLAVNALQLGLTIDIDTHVMYSDSELSKYLQLNTHTLPQVTRLRLNSRKRASDLVISMCEQGNHSKTLTVVYPAPSVAALLHEQPTREQVQLAASAAPGKVLLVGSGSDNYGHLSGCGSHRENLAVWLARPGTADAAQLPLRSWGALLENPPVPTATKGTCPTLAVARLTGRECDTDLVRVVDGVRLELSTLNKTGYVGVTAQRSPSGQTGFGWQIRTGRYQDWQIPDTYHSASSGAIFDTAVGAALDRAKEVAKIAP